MSLTDTKVRSAKPAQTIVKLSDGGGLQLWIMPSGSKIWNLAYRFAGKQKKLTIGHYPEISLQLARQRRQEAKAMLQKEIDPSEHKQRVKLIKAEANAHTFALIANELIAKKQREGKAPATLIKLEWLYSLAFGEIGSRPIADISAADILSVLRKIEIKGRLVTAMRLRSFIGEVFRYAIATTRVKDDPTYALRGALTSPTTTPRAALLNPVAFGGC